ncbi:MAG: T9SS type A sorting domain-containing protein [Flavobacteriaceae bacterium]|nr:T9SS type A sorting domain-containing protein [Flavobacteriaceae bacterium]
MKHIILTLMFLTACSMQAQKTYDFELSQDDNQSSKYILNVISNTSFDQANLAIAGFSILIPNGVIIELNEPFFGEIEDWEVSSINPEQLSEVGVKSIGEKVVYFSLKPGNYIYDCKKNDQFSLISFSLKNTNSGSKIELLNDDSAELQKLLKSGYDLRSNFQTSSVEGQLTRDDHNKNMGSTSFELIDEIKAEIIVYPNPVVNSVSLSVKEGEQHIHLQSYQIYDVSGDLKLKGNINSEKLTNLNLGSLTTGVYFINIKTQNETLIKQIVKK